MPYVFLDKPPLAVPESLELSDRAQDYVLPETPPGLAVNRIPATINDVRMLLPAELLPIFQDAVDSSNYKDLEWVVSGWGVFAVHLHNPNYQADSALIAEGRIDELLVDAVSEPALTEEEHAKIARERINERMFVDGREVMWVEEE